jgi:carboxyl-terminal processing protease
MRRRILLSAVLVLVLAIVVGGTAIGVQRWRAASLQKNTFPMKDLKTVKAAEPKIDPHLRVYDDVLMLVRLRYVDEPNMPKAADGGLHGLLEGLDANSAYLNAAQYRDYKDAQTAKNGATAGIGAFVSKRFGYAGVVAVLPGSPAAQAGMESGDVIESLDGASTHALALAQIRQRLMGTAGTKVEMGLIRARKIEPEKVTVTLADVAIPPLAQKLMPGNVGYVGAQVLSQGRAQEIGAAIKALEAQGAKGFVIDLRDAAWGNAEEGVALANLFVERGRLAYLAGQKFQQVNYDADPQKVVTKLPVVVMVSRGTAGAAELAAAAIMDNGRGDVVGEKTFGDDSVQKLFESPDRQSAMILSIAKYYRQTGKIIQENGITPSVEAATNPPAISDNQPPPGSPAAAQLREAERSQQLQKAVEVLQKKLGGAR